MIHILLAAYNEEKGLGPVLNDIARCLADGDFTVWVVDDGSTDATASVVADWRRKIPLESLRHPANRGLGASLQTGFMALSSRLSKNDTVVTLDADNTHPPALIPRLVQPLDDDRADVVIASRFVPGARVVGVPWFRRLLSLLASWLFRWALPIPGVRDYTCGFRAVRGELILKSIERWGRLIEDNGFTSTAELLVKWRFFNPRVLEIPLVLRYDRKIGPTKMVVLKTVIRTMRLILVMGQANQKTG